MTAAMAMPGNTTKTFLVHFFGTGLADDRYVVERFRTLEDGDIVPAPAEVLTGAALRRRSAPQVVDPVQLGVYILDVPRGNSYIHSVANEGKHHGPNEPDIHGPGQG